MPDKIKILFTGGGGVGNEAIYRLLNDQYDLYFADMNLGAICTSIPQDRKLKILPAKNPSFEADIIRLVNENGIDIMVPGVDEELLKFCDMRSKLDAWVLLPERSFVDLMLNKYKCIKDMKERGLDVPETYLVSEVENYNTMSFPKIIKPIVGRGSRGVALVGSPEEVQGYMMFNKASPENIILQELGTGEEYTVFVSANKFGELNAIVPVKVHEKKGVTVIAEAYNNNQVINYVKAFHAQYKPSGVYNLQCMVPEDGRVTPFEINPRVSTTFCLSLYAGFDPFALYGLPASEVYEIKKPYFLRRFTHNEMFD